MSTGPLALLSVSDKQGVVELGEALVAAGFGLLSTGGTASLLRESGLAVTDVAEHTGAAEMMAGRVKTLHPVVHGGLLGRRGVDDAVMRERGIAPIDIVVVNLYPFASTVARADVSFDDAIENIDIGGPAMIRSAAKNHACVAVVTDPADYPRLVASLTADQEEQAALRFDLAVKAFEHTARYDGMIAEWLGARVDQGPSEPPADFPRTLNRQYQRVQTLRYGENPHQRAAFYREPTPAPGTLAAATLVQGKALSYNNVMDADAALGCVQLFSEQPACVIVKHANPCGVSQSDSLLQAYENAYRTDPTSAFGGIIAFNRPLDLATADTLASRQFVEVIIAPGLAPGVVERLAKHPNIRVLDVSVPGNSGLAPREGASGYTLRPVSGGLLVQDEDVHRLAESDLQLVSERKPEGRELADLMFAWRVAQYVKSNAIVYARDLATVGVGAGQMSRVYSSRIAAIKAADEGIEVHGAVMASDAFFPFRDGIDSAAEVGIAAVIQPGGSKNDEQVIAAANEHGMAMVFTDVRHFRH